MSEHLIIITGASSGIGAAIAAAAAADGAEVATMSRRPGPGKHLAVDLADPAQWGNACAWVDRCIDQAIGTGVERVSFVHNAGTLAPIGFAGDVAGQEYTNNVLVNAASGQVLGAGFLATTNRLGMPGVLVLVSSGAGKNPVPGWSSYCAAKAAADMWVQVTGLEQEALAASTTVVSVAPGVVDTDMQGSIRASDQSQFPAVDRFRSMHAEGELRSAGEVGAQYWKLCQRTDLTQGAVGSINDFA